MHVYGLQDSVTNSTNADAGVQASAAWPFQDARGRSHKNSHLFLRQGTHPAAASLELGCADLRDVPVCRAPRGITVSAITPRWLPTRRVSAVSPVPAVPFGCGCAVTPLVAVSGIAACGGADTHGSGLLLVARTRSVTSSSSRLGGAELMRFCDS